MVVHLYIDFLIKSLDVKSKTSRKAFWAVLLVNAALAVLLVSIGLAIPKGRPLQIYIGVSSILATPLFVPFFTCFARRLNDMGRSRLWMLLFLIPVVGFLILLVICAFQGETEDTFDDWSGKNGAAQNAVKKVIDNILTLFPFAYLVFTIYKVATATDSVGKGVNASLMAFTILICVFTLVEFKTKRGGRLLAVWKAIKKLTSLSGAMLSIILYSGSQGFVDSVALVYFYFYVMIIPIVLVVDVYKIVKR